MRRIRNFAARGGLAGAVVGALLACGMGDAPEAADAPAHSAPIEAEGATFVGSAACAPCHPQQQELWTGSQHDLAMQPATEETVLGDFDDARFGQVPGDEALLQEGEEVLRPHRGSLTFPCS